MLYVNYLDSMVRVLREWERTRLEEECWGETKKPVTLLETK